MAQVRNPPGPAFLTGGISSYGIGKHMRRQPSLGPAGLAFLAASPFFVLSGLAGGVAGQGLVTDPFVTQVVGEWQGRGEYDGNSLKLTRSWTLELQDQFLRAEMRVGMPNGFSFGALMYWSWVAPDVYEIVWMDGLGRRQALRATRDPDSGLVSTTYLDELAEDGPEWRTWEFESLGPNAYVERLFKVVTEGRELLTTFSFDRASGS